CRGICPGTGTVSADEHPRLHSLAQVLRGSTAGPQGLHVGGVLAGRSPLERDLRRSPSWQRQFAK
ncbi:MAG TPA: hypothetical protein PKA88_10415, partial [Polyangiaceae bacterium]|nr:hypothetical protein [Polyangiaceae bacterium]